MVGDHPVGVELVGRLSRRSGTDRETLREVRKWSGDHLGSPELVGRPSRKSGTSRDTQLGGPELVWRPFQKSGSGRAAPPEVRKWSEDPPGGPVVVG